MDSRDDCKIQTTSSIKRISVDDVFDMPLYKSDRLLYDDHDKPKFIVNDIHAGSRGAKVWAASLPFGYVSPEMNLIQVLPEYQGDRQAYLVYKERKYQPKALTCLLMH